MRRRFISKEVNFSPRVVSWEIFPLSFRAFLDIKGIESDGHLSTKQRLTIQKAFEDAGLLFSVNILSSSPTRISVNPRKVYSIDHALAVSTSSGILTNRDSLLENIVFTALRRVTPEIFYHKTKTGREVDLVTLLPSVPGQEGAVMLVQVCASLTDPRVKQSEVRSLSEAMVELTVAEGTIVTWRTAETIPVGFGTIHVIPVWRFLLEMEPRG